jgi:Fur family ferric uptake transcriptional regulator
MKQTRQTRQRRLVLEAVLQSRDHPTAENLYNRVREIEPRISRATVYRNLRVLAAHNAIRQMKSAGVDRFDWKTEPHYHLVCAGCNTLWDAPIDYQGGLDELAAQKTGCEILRHRTIFEVLCADCAKKPAPRPE